MATAEERVYYSQCGWDGWTYEGVQREHLRFSDSHVTGLYKAASSPDSRRPDVDLVKGGWQGVSLKTVRPLALCVERTRSRMTWHLLAGSSGPPTARRKARFSAVNSASHSDPQYLCVFDGALFFGAIIGTWPGITRFSKEDATGRGVMRLVADIRRGPREFDPKHLSAVGVLCSWRTTG